MAEDTGAGPLDGIGIGATERHDPLAALRAAGEGWSGPGADALGEVIDGLEGPLGRSYLLGQPNVAGMGVAAWGLSLSAINPPSPERAARRMVGKGMLGDFLGPDEDEDEAARLDDPGALGRGADLVDALQRLQAAAVAAAEAPPPVRAQIDTLRRDLHRRLRAEARLSPALRRRLDALDPDDPTAIAALRAAAAPPEERVEAEAAPAPRPIPRRPSADDPYTAAVDTAVAREPAPETPALATLRDRIASTAERALRAPADSERGKRLVEQARRLLAEEVRLTDGRLAADAARDRVDTAALRRALAAREGAAARPEAPAEGGVAPRADLPEVPILSSRGERARVVGYLRAGEATAALRRAGGHVQVAAPGQRRPGWIPEAMLVAADRPLAWPGPLGQPSAPEPAARRAAGAISPELARLAMLVSGQTGTPLSALIDAAGDRPVVTEPAKPKPARRARGEAAAAPAPAAEARAPITIGRVDVSGLDGPDAAEAAAVLNAALAALPATLDARLRGDPERLRRLRAEGTHQSALSVPLRVEHGGDPKARGRVLADQMADALVRSGASRIDTLRLGVDIPVAPLPTPAELFDRIAGGDTDGIATDLAAERKALDGTVHGRLTQFFGHDFKDAMVFAGPMAGTLARAIRAEAFTHGKMVFFDPQHYQPGSARSEALLAHELTHTRQADDRDVRIKEAEAIIAEARYLDWLQPGGAPLAMDGGLDPTMPEAAMAADVAGGFLRSRQNRDRAMDGENGPRIDRAKQEERVAQVLEMVRMKLEQEDDAQAQRLGRLGMKPFGGIT